MTIIHGSEVVLIALTSRIRERFTTSSLRIEEVSGQPTTAMTRFLRHGADFLIISDSS